MFLKHPQECEGVNDTDALVFLEHQQILVLRHKKRRAPRNGRREELVNVRVTGDCGD